MLVAPVVQEISISYVVWANCSKEHEQYYGLLHKEEIIKNKLVGWAKSYFSDEELDNFVYEFNKKHFIDLDMEKEITPFFDWLFLEAVNKEEEKRILDIIIDNYSHLFQSDELSILEEWRDNTQSGIYEILETYPQKWEVKIKEVFTEKEYTIIDRKASEYVVKGDILFGRLQKVFSYNYLSGVCQTYPRLHVFEKLKNFINNHLENEKKKNPNISYEEFMNNNSKILNEFSPENMKIVSSDNEEVEISEAIYSMDIKNIDNVLDYFDDNPDKFIITDVDFKNNKFISANIAYKRRIEKEIKVRLIANSSIKDIFTKHHKYKDMGIKYTDLQLPSGIFIYRHNVMTLTWNNNPAAFVITSKSNADSYRAFFEELWKLAKR